MVKVLVPTVAELLAFSVKALLVPAGGVTELGLNDAVTPLGNSLALTLRVTF